MLSSSLHHTSFTVIVCAKLKLHIDVNVCERTCWCVCVFAYPQYVGLQLQFSRRCRVHEAQQCTHVIVPAGRQDQLLDDEQCVFPTLTVLYNVVNTASATKLSEEGWEEHTKRD